MRTIKFRGYNAQNKEWLYGCYLINRGEYFICPDGEQPHDKTWEDFQINPESVGQFTGLHDKNGKEIYEGDILHVKLYRNAFMNESKEFRDAFDIDDLKGELMEEFTSQVEFTECSFDIRDFYLDSFGRDPKHCYPIHDIEVIGNIHTNPELLKGGEK